MPNRAMCRALAAVAWSVLVAAASAQQPILAGGESTEIASQVSGSYRDTWFPYDAAETLTEAESEGGKPSKHTSLLRHVWYFDVPAVPSAVLQVRASRTDHGEGDDFVLSWSNDQGQSYHPIYTVAQATMPAMPEEVVLPAAATGGVLWLRASDTDRTSGRRELDTLTVDYLAIVPAPPGPPAAPFWTQASGMSTSTVFVGWFDLAADEDGYRVERSLPGANAWVVAGMVGANEMLFVDDGLPASTSYDYRVFAFNAQGDSAPSEVVPAATRAIGSYAAEIAAPYDSSHPIAFADHASTASGEVLLGFGGEGVYLATRNPATWNWFTELVDPSRIVFDGGDFGIAPDGTPRFTYIETRLKTTIRNVRFAERRDGAWQIDLIDTEAANDRVCFAFDPTDPDGQDLAVAYTKFRYKWVSFSRDFAPGLFVARRIDGQWTVDNVDPDALRARRPSIAFSPGGELMVAYTDLYKYQGYLHQQIQFVVHDGSGWRAPEVVVQLADAAVRHPSLAVDPVSGRPAIAVDRGSELLFLQHDGGAWSSQTVATVGAEEEIGGVRVEFGSGGEPNVAYARPSGVFLARRDGASWTSECIDPVGSFGYSGMVGLEVDAQGEASFSYHAQIGGAGMTVYARR